MKPTFYLVGAMKAGTTSLHEYLSVHPDIFMSEPKEINFFSNERFWRKGHAWYERHFPSAAPMRGESSTSYTAYPVLPHVPQRISQYTPDAKLLYLVRNPIERLVSQYVHHVSEGLEMRTLPEVVRQIQQGNEEPYVAQSRYFMQISRFLKYFDRSQFLIITTEALKAKRHDTLRAIHEFLGVPPLVDQLSPECSKNRSSDVCLQRNALVNVVYPRWLQRHPRMPWSCKSPFFHAARMLTKPISKPPLSREERECLETLFQPDIRNLETLVGRTLSEWSEGKLAASEWAQ